LELRCSYDRGLDRLASLPQLRQVDIKRFPHFGPDETEQLLQVWPVPRRPSFAGNCAEPQPANIYLFAVPARQWLIRVEPPSITRGYSTCAGVNVQCHCVLRCQQAEGIEQVNDRCKLVRRHSVAPQRALDTKLQGVALR
jgi:hypothetical protein